MSKAPSGVALLLPVRQADPAASVLDHLHADARRLAAFARILSAHAANGLDAQGSDREALARFLGDELPPLASLHLCVVRTVRGVLLVGDPRDVVLRRLELRQRRVLGGGRRVARDLSAAATDRAAALRAQRLAAVIASTSELMLAFVLPLAHSRLGPHDLRNLRERLAPEVDRDQHRHT